MHFFQKKKKRIYLDYAAATPLRRQVQEAMRPFEDEVFANPSAIHTEGRQARKAIEDARAELAHTLKIRPTGIVFTASGTESNNLALIGVVEARRTQGVAYADMEIISTHIEHPSITKTLAYLETLGVTLRYMEVDSEGKILLESLQSQLSEKTVLVTFAYANSEIGVVQNVGRIAREVHAYAQKQDMEILVHTDAAQAPLWLPCQLERLHVDILTLDAGKCYGPKGVGVLAMRHGVSLRPIFWGGPQEHKLRPATENTPGIVGAVKAICIAQEEMTRRAAKVSALRDTMIAQCLEIEGVLLNGSKEDRIANNVHISIPGIDSEFAVVVLDEHGVACSTKSACSAGQGGGSSVVYAVSDDPDRATSPIRFSLGEETTSSEVKRAVGILRTHIEKMRKLSS